ncbi:aspartyl protease family protein [Maribellus sediminis]|uniref:aspartyl protease family protein n=1 Tax=Maribellus sediminis TaxID=2696285 RepID=UPI00143022D3|nr:hypothetical protein [Maribellus sediminis]
MNQPFFVSYYLYPMRYKIPIELIELEDDNYHLVVSSDFADRRKGIWVIDTGASKSIFDKTLESDYTLIDGLSEDLHSAGISDDPIKSEVANMNPFSFSGMKIENMKVAVLDLSHINQLYAASTDIVICGLLGGDFLVRYQAVIDYKRKRMLLRK